MKHLITILVALLSISAFAKDPGLGVTVGDSKGFAVGDFNSFHHDETTMGVFRYGDAFNRLQIGNGIGFSVSGSTGFVLCDTGPMVGLEPFGGKAVANTNSSIQSFYEWTPLLSVGYHVVIPGASLIALGKGGSGIGTIARNGLIPDVVLAYGVSVSADTLLGQLDYDYLALTEDRYISGLGFQLDKIALRYERSRGIIEEASWILLWRKKL